MTGATRRWRVRLAEAAEADFEDILCWTVERFGERQARVYAETLSRAPEDVTAGPAAIGVQPRNDIAKGLFTLHVARHGRKGRHFVLFRVDRDSNRNVIDVLRILHDAMDLPRHVPSIDENE